MKARDRVQLRAGPYKSPSIPIGTIISCESRDTDVIVIDYSDAKIPWPIGRRPRLGAKSLIVFGDLAEAVKQESCLAVAHWFGVSTQTVTVWRRNLGVPAVNPGTRALKSDYFFEPWAKRAQKKAWAKGKDPERCAKIAASKVGKKRPPHVIEAMRIGRTGKPQSAETRKKMSISQQANRGPNKKAPVLPDASA